MEANPQCFYIRAHLCTCVLNTPDYPVDLQRTCRGAQKHGTRVASINNRELNVSVKVQTNKGL